MIGVVNGPPKNESHGILYPSLGISHNLLMGLGVSDLCLLVTYMLFY